MESLPKGLLTTATKVSTELDGMGRVDVGDVVQLWRGGLVRAFLVVNVTCLIVPQSTVPIPQRTMMMWGTDSKTSFGGYGVASAWVRVSGGRR